VFYKSYNPWVEDMLLLSLTELPWKSKKYNQVPKGELFIWEIGALWIKVVLEYAY